MDTFCQIWVKMWHIQCGLAKQGCPVSFCNKVKLVLVDLEINVCFSLYGRMEMFLITLFCRKTQTHYVDILITIHTITIITILTYVKV